MQRQDAANAHSGEYSTPAEQSHSMSTIAHYMAQPSGKHLLTTKNRTRLNVLLEAKHIIPMWTVYRTLTPRAVSPVTSRAVYFKPDTLGWAPGSRSTQGINDRPFFVISYDLRSMGLKVDSFTAYSPQYSSVYYESDADDGLSDEDMPGLFSASTRRRCSKILSSDTARNYLPSYFGQGIIDDGAEADEESDGGEYKLLAERGKRMKG
ncbi:hypothetical protein BDP27DRAFT_1367461 [Rhodocollybia butyracea]|uniref:Uncharacterized protein n=1 Tax=Rhodocollybia butyracea TaxID=206335 RepID=A0A9P5PIM4_9AGAR|nr:hypothetical protein BDP27DRAFT_1367461 [Rhodocollybia butyracea]